MNEFVFGRTEIDKEYLFFSYEPKSEKITIYTGGRLIEIPDNLNVIIGDKIEKIGNGTILYKLSVPMSNDSMSFKDGKAIGVSIANQIRPVEYFIENYKRGSKYTEMRLQFSELDYFIPSSGISSLSENKELVFSREKHFVYQFDIMFRNEMISVYFTNKMSGLYGVKAKAETISEITINFPETSDMEYIIDLYYAVRNFFTFVCNRQNIGLRDATLIGEYPKKTTENGKVIDTIGRTIQKLTPSHKYLEPLKDEKQIKKTPNSILFASKIKELFQLFFEVEKGGIAIVNGNDMPRSLKYRNLIDLEQSLHTTATFEFYMRTLLPEVSSKDSLIFYKDIESLIENYANNATGKVRKKAINFKKSLRPQISLEDKINKVYTGYSNWKSIEPILVEWYGNNISNLASAANLWRNELAHEKREYQPSENVIDAIRLVEHINYCIVLRYAGYNDKQIKSIVNAILIR